MLGGEGLPMAYVRDYLQEPDCYGLARTIANLTWVNRTHANGPTVERWGNEHVHVFERTGYPGLIVALNNDFFNPAWKTVTVQTSQGANVRWHDFTGHNQMDCWSNSRGQITFGIPAGANGLGYGMWGRADVDGPIHITPRSTTQTFFGAADLDIGPAVNEAKIIGRIWCAKSKPIHLKLTADRTGWVGNSHIQVQVHAQDGSAAGGCMLGVTGDASGESTTTQLGWHTLTLTGNLLPATGSSFELETTYMGGSL
jgi:hypothetical protein